MKLIRYIRPLLFSLVLLFPFSVSAAERVNINTASVEELADGLVGIGLSKARAIVEYRELNGEFETVDSLAQVKGIGEATVKKNSERIAVTE